MDLRCTAHIFACSYVVVCVPNILGALSLQKNCCSELHILVHDMENVASINCELVAADRAIEYTIGIRKARLEAARVLNTLADVTLAVESVCCTLSWTCTMKHGENSLRTGAVGVLTDLSKFFYCMHHLVLTLGNLQVPFLAYERHLHSPLLPRCLFWETSTTAPKPSRTSGRINRGVSTSAKSTSNRRK